MLRMKYVLAVFALVAAVTSPGCAGSPAAQYRNAVITYDRTARLVETLTRTGVIDDSELADIKPFERAAHASLMRVRARVEAGEEITWGDIDDITAALDAFGQSLDTEPDTETDTGDDTDGN